MRELNFSLRHAPSSAIKIQKTACREVRAVEFNPRSRRPIRKFYKALNFNPQRTQLNFNSRRKSILAIKIPSQQNFSRAALSYKFNLAVRRKIKSIVAYYTPPQAGILFGKDRLPRY